MKYFCFLLCPEEPLATSNCSRWLKRGNKNTSVYLRKLLGVILLILHSVCVCVCYCVCVCLISDTFLFVFLQSCWEAFLEATSELALCVCVFSTACDCIWKLFKVGWPANPQTYTHTLRSWLVWCHRCISALIWSDSALFTCFVPSSLSHGSVMFIWVFADLKEI